jgi:hypothetical protein
MAKSEYIPGVCNLGKAEIRARWIAAAIGFGTTSLCLLIFLFFAVPWYFKILIFIPASVGFAGLLQARFQFCIKFGFQGVFNIGSQLGKTDTVEQAEFRKKDRQRAIQIAVGGGALAAALTGFVLTFL